MTLWLRATSTVHTDFGLPVELNQSGLRDFVAQSHKGGSG
jgi:hypothetical protein